MLRFFLLMMKLTGSLESFCGRLPSREWMFTLTALSLWGQDHT